MNNFLDKTGLSYFWEKVKTWADNRFYKKTGGDLDGNITFVKKEGQVARSIGFGNTGADGTHLTFSGNAIQFSGPEGSFFAMSGRKIELLGDASMDTDAVTYKQLKERAPSSPGNSQVGWVATVVEDGDGGVKPEWKELPDMIEVEGGGTAQMAASLGQGPFTIEFTEDEDANFPASAVDYNNAETGMVATNMQDAVDELFTSVSNGKSLIAGAITDKGVSTSADATFQQMAENIGKIDSASGFYIAKGESIQNLIEQGYMPSLIQANIYLDSPSSDPYNLNYILYSACLAEYYGTVEVDDKQYKNWILSIASDNLHFYCNDTGEEIDADPNNGEITYVTGGTSKIYIMYYLLRSE